MSEIIAVDQLKQYISKIESLEQNKLNIQDDIKQIFDHAKASGFDVKVMKQVIKIKKQDKDSIAEQEAILNLYLEALEV